MKKTLGIFAFLIVQSLAFGQTPFSGEIEYEATIRLDLEAIRANMTNPEMAANIPDVINFTEKLFVNGSAGKKERIMAQMRGNWGTRQPQGNSGGNGNGGNNANADMARMRRALPETFYDFASKKILTVHKFPKDSVNTDMYLVETVIEFTKDLKETPKTKKILGYNCKKATVKGKDDTFTVWYTTEMGFTYSPLMQSSTQAAAGMGGWGRASAMMPQFPVISIDNAVILAVEGTDIGFEAKKINTTNILKKEDLTVPVAAKKSTPEEVQELQKKYRANNRNNWGNR